jgi:hypothetical protein
MKLNREAFVAVLEQVKPALASAGSIPELKHVWLDGKYLYAYNGALGIRVDWATELQPCGLLGSVLLGLLQNTSAKEIEVTQEAASQLDLKMGRASATVPLMAIDHNPWPFPAKVPAGKVVTFALTDAFVEGLKQVRIIKAADPKMVEHYGVILFPAKDALTLYTTDSKSLAEVPVQGKFAKELAKAVLPFGFVNQLLAFKAGAKVSFTQDAIIAEAEGVQVCSNLLDTADVHDLPKLVTTTIGKEDTAATPLPKEFSEALDRALILAGGDLDKAFVTLTASKKDLSLSGKLANGVLQEKFTLGSSSSGTITIGLEQIKGLAKDAEDFAIVQKALLLFGKNDALYLIAAHEEGK